MAVIGVRSLAWQQVPKVYFSHGGFSEDDRYSKVPLSPAKTDAQNNVRIVDKGNEFPHYTEDTVALQ
jgi:hypothetical protein